MLKNLKKWQKSSKNTNITDDSNSKNKDYFNKSTSKYWYNYNESNIISDLDEKMIIFMIIMNTKIFYYNYLG